MRGRSSKVRCFRFRPKEPWALGSHCNIRQAGLFEDSEGVAPEETPAVMPSGAQLWTCKLGRKFAGLCLFVLASYCWCPGFQPGAYMRGTLWQYVQPHTYHKSDRKGLLWD